MTAPTGATGTPDSTATPDPTGTPDSTDRRARLLHDAYVAKINAAIGSGRDDLVAELAENYRREAHRALAPARQA